MSDWISSSDRDRESLGGRQGRMPRQVSPSPNSERKRSKYDEKRYHKR